MTQTFDERRNGHQDNQGKGTPSLEDLFLFTERTNPNIIAEMMTTDSKPEKFIPRSHLTRAESLALQRLQIMWDVWHDREVDMESIIWRRAAFSIAEGGRGRNQVVQMLSGAANRVRDRFAGIGRQPHDLDTGGR